MELGKDAERGLFQVGREPKPGCGVTEGKTGRNKMSRNFLV